jgi:hypothetical protein
MTISLYVRETQRFPSVCVSMYNLPLSQVIRADTPTHKEIVIQCIPENIRGEPRVNNYNLTSLIIDQLITKYSIIIGH